MSQLKRRKRRGELQMAVAAEKAETVLQSLAKERADQEKEHAEQEKFHAEQEKLRAEQELVKGADCRPCGWQAVTQAQGLSSSGTSRAGALS